jgi:hypothetical protein
MAKEIETLLEAQSQGCWVVEKDTHVLWEREALVEARQGGGYQEEGEVWPADGQLDVSGPFPGCLQGGGATAAALEFRLVGQTKHFVLFMPAQRQPQGPRDDSQRQLSLEQTHHPG